MIKVDAAAQRTDGYQRNDNLLLSDRARSDSIPGLEIEADDVLYEDMEGMQAWLFEQLARFAKEHWAYEPQSNRRWPVRTAAVTPGSRS